MQKTLIIGTALLALAGCKGRDEALAPGNYGTTDQLGAPDAVGTATAINPSAGLSATPAYVNNAAMGDLYEIQSSRLALIHAASPQVKQLAQKMIDDHTATTAALKDAVLKTGKHIALPGTLDQKHEDMLAALKDRQGADFDAAYIAQQTKAHQQALSLHRDYADAGEDAPLKQFAAQTAPKIQQHLDMILQFDKQP